MKRKLFFQTTRKSLPRSVTPELPKQGTVGFAEMETPLPPRRGEITWAELEVPERKE